MHSAKKAPTEHAELPVVALVGNPNVGKSVFFSLMTGRYVVVSNYPGTTVEVSSGTARFAGRQMEVVDTPGVNSLIPRSEDEEVARAILIDRKPAAVVQVADGKNLRRSLMITTQLAEMGLPVTMALNMWDEALDRGIDVDTAALSRITGVPVVKTVAVQKQGIGALQSSLAEAKPPSLRINYGPEIEAEIERLAPLLPAGRMVVAESGIETHWGIITDEHQQSSARDVYAAGDVAETEDLLTRERTVHAIWPNASEQGRVAGFNMAGQERSYPGSLAMNAVDFYGTPVMAVGNVRPREEGFEEVVDYRPERGLYRKMVLREGKLAGLLVVGEMRGTGAALALIKAGVPVEEIRELIMSDEFDYAKIVRLVKAYPEAFGEREFRLTVRSGAGG